MVYIGMKGVHFLVSLNTLLLIVSGHKAATEEDQAQVDQISLDEEQAAAQEEHRRIQKIIEKEKAMYEEQDWRVRARLYYERHTIEIILIIVFVILALNFVMGRYVNQKMADKWLK